MLSQGLLFEKERDHVPLVDVFSDIPPDDIGIGPECVEIGVTKLGGHLETHVKKLTEVLVVGWIALIMAQGTGVLLAGPSVDLRGPW